jgi:hypothetical protein
MAQRYLRTRGIPASPQSASSGNTLGGIIGFVLLGTIEVCVIKFLLKIGSRILAPVATPTPADTVNQRETLDDLRKGITPDRYNLSGFVCKKNEKVLFSFQA